MTSKDYYEMHPEFVEGYHLQGNEMTKNCFNCKYIDPLPAMAPCQSCGGLAGEFKLWEPQEGADDDKDSGSHGDADRLRIAAEKAGDVC